MVPSTLTRARSADCKSYRQAWGWVGVSPRQTQVKADEQEVQQGLPRPAQWPRAGNSCGPRQCTWPHRAPHWRPLLRRTHPPRIVAHPSTRAARTKGKAQAGARTRVTVGNVFDQAHHHRVRFHLRNRRVSRPQQEAGGRQVRHCTAAYAILSRSGQSRVERTRRQRC
jgi:hypothetical protein